MAVVVQVLDQPTQTVRVPRADFKSVKYSPKLEPDHRRFLSFIFPSKKIQEAWSLSEDQRLTHNLQLAAVENTGINFNFLFSNGFRTELKMNTRVLKNCDDLKDGKVKLFALPANRQVRKVQIYYHAQDFGLWGLKFFDDPDS